MNPQASFLLTNVLEHTEEEKGKNHSTVCHPHFKEGSQELNSTLPTPALIRSHVQTSHFLGLIVLFQSHCHQHGTRNKHKQKLSTHNILGNTGASVHLLTEAQATLLILTCS